MPISLDLRLFRGQQRKQTDRAKPARVRVPCRPTVNMLETRLVMSATSVKAIVPAPFPGLFYVEGSTVMVNLATHLPANAVPDSLTMSWGDGSTPTTAQAPFFPSALPGASSISPSYPVFVDGVMYSEFQGQHVYMEEGTYQVQLTIKEHDFSTGKALSDVTLHGSIQVQDAGLSPSSSNTPLLAAPGQAFTGQVASFQSMSTGLQTDPAADFTATIDWGDQTSTSQGTVTARVPPFGWFPAMYSVNGSHTYKTAGDYHVTVQVKDKGGSTVQLSREIIVADLGNIDMTSITVNPGSGVTLNYTVNGPVIAPVKVAFFGSMTGMFDASVQKAGVVSLTSTDLQPGKHQITVNVTHPSSAAFLYVGVRDSQGTPSEVYGGADWVSPAPTNLTLVQVITTGLNADTLTVTSSAPIQANPGQPVTFTAKVIPSDPNAGLPTGTVVFQNNTGLLGLSTILGTATLKNVNGVAQATLTTSTLPPGFDEFTVFYQGDENFLSSQGLVGQTITNITSQVSVIWDPSKAGASSGSFLVTVSALPPASGTPTGGEVQFWDNLVLLGVAGVTNGKAAFPASGLSSGLHHITAKYLGDPIFTESNPYSLDVSVS